MVLVFIAAGALALNIAVFLWYCCCGEPDVEAALKSPQSRRVEEPQTQAQLLSFDSRESEAPRHEAHDVAYTPAVVQAKNLVAATPMSSVARYRPCRTDQDRHLTSLPLKVASSSRLVMLDCVFDGHGGSFSCEFLLRNAPQYFKVELMCDPKIELLTLLERVIAKLEHDLLRELCWLQLQDGAAGTIVLTELCPADPTQLLCACGNLGDCDAYLFMADGSYSMLSASHRLTNQKERARVAAAGGYLGREDRMVHLASMSDMFNKSRGGDDVDANKSDDDEAGDESDDDEREAKVFRTYAHGAAWQGSTRDSLQATRSFGDYKWKHSAFGILNQEAVRAKGIVKGSREWRSLQERLYSLLSSFPSLRLTRVRPAIHRFLVMGSDGFWDAFPDPSAVYAFLSNMELSPESVCEALVNAARKAIPEDLKSADDCTVLVIDIEQRLEDHMRLQNMPVAGSTTAKKLMFEAD